jgi:hypothetical protein
MCLSLLFKYPEELVRLIVGHHHVRRKALETNEL